MTLFARMAAGGASLRAQMSARHLISSMLSCCRSTRLASAALLDAAAGCSASAGVVWVAPARRVPARSGSFVLSSSGACRRRRAASHSLALSVMRSQARRSMHKPTGALDEREALAGHLPHKALPRASTAATQRRNHTSPNSARLRLIHHFCERCVPLPSMEHAPPRFGKLLTPDLPSSTSTTLPEPQ